MICSAFFGNQMAGRVRPRIAMISGIVLMIVGLNLMMFIFSERWFNGWTLFLPYLLILIGGFITWLFASSKALSEARDKSTASAVIQFLNMGIATLGTLIVGAFAPKIPSTLSIAFGACIIVMFFLWLSLHEHHKRSPH
jgi:predicted MFS family arabinose efflux permease